MSSSPRDPLADYRNRRDFDRTPEPSAEPIGTGDEKPIFVVQRHEASRLHYDLRLEHEGVLVSFAVPKGLPPAPGLRRLAVRTEDHPLSYAHFEGTIPEGEYGAGVMAIVDRGAYTSRTELGPGLDEGKLELILHGSVVRGEWHLVRVDSGDWLLLKTRDRYVRSESERPFPYPLYDEAPRPLPRSFRPALPGAAVEPFSDRQWAFTPALDGMRCGVLIQEGSITLRIDGKNRADAFPELLRELEGLPVESALLDAWLVSPGEDGTPDRTRLDERLAGEVDHPVELYVIDLLHYEDWRMTDRSFRDRWRAVQSIVREQSRVRRLDPLPGDGQSIARGAADLGLEQLWARDLNAPYRAGEQSSWRIVSLDSLPRTRPRSGRRSRLEISNPEKVYWPQSGWTKGELLDYYRTVAPLLLPHLRGRPLHLYRFPEGIEGEGFFHKHAPEHTPDWVPTVELSTSEEEKAIRHYLCEDLRTLIYLVNLGSIDLHPWGSTIDAPGNPDRLIFDLDPGEGGYANTVKVARELGKRLRALGMRPLVKTSGSKGLHIVLALIPRYGYEQVGMFAEMIARWLVRDFGSIATVERSPARRGSRVYIDTLQNRRGQTVVPPYVVRPVPAASVSVPLDWDELDAAVPPSHYPFPEVLARFEAKGDLAETLFEDPHEIESALEALGEHFPRKD